MSGRSSRRAAVDREELFQAANSMLQEGKPVTALALLEALGGGSLRTIYKYLAEWEAKQKEPAQAAISKVPEAVQNAFASTWLAAVAEAAKEVAAEKEKAAEEVRQAQKKFEEALEGIQKLEAQGGEDAVQIEQLKDQIDHMSAENTRRLTNLAGQVEQLQQQVASLQKKSEQLENDRALVTIKLGETAERLKTAEKKQESANKEREAAIKEAAGLKGQVQALTAQNTELMSKLAERPARPRITAEQMAAKLS